MKATDLKIEFLKNPLGIDVRNPRLTWNCEGGKKQSAFRIECTGNGKVLWDTGKVTTDRMNALLDVPYQSRLRVDVKVTLWDETGNAGEASTCFFEYGLLEKNDFSAKWISGNVLPTKKKRYPVDCFRKCFVQENIQNARLYISAQGLYEAKINGLRAGDFVLAPGSTDYRKRTQYQTYDVTSLLKNGENVFTAELADGWYRGSSCAKGRTYTYGTRTKLYVQLEMTGTDGKRTAVCSDESFEWSNDGPILFSDLKDGEIVDANKVPSYSGKAVAVKADTVLTCSDNVEVKEHEIFLPKRLIRTPKGDTVLEYPQNLCGYVAFSLDAHKGDVIHLRLGEMLDQDGEFTQKNIQCIYKGKKSPLQEISYTCREGKNEYKSKFFFGGFQYVLVSVDSEKGTEILPENFRQIAVYSDVEKTCSFDSSNGLLNRFFDSTLWSLKSNSVDLPSDCPTRERMGWTGDSQIFFNTASFLTDYAAFSKKHVRDIYDRQWKDGKLPQIAPYANEEWFMSVMNGSVGWADAGILIPYRHYKKYGDLRILEEYYDRMVKYAKFMIHRCGHAKGIYAIYAKPLHLSKENRKYGVNSGQSYGEWAEPSDVKSFVWTDFCCPHPEESMAYTVWMMELMIEISGLVHRTEDVALFRKYRDGIRKAYEELVTKEEYSLDTDRQAKLVRPLYLNLLTEKQKAFAGKRLIQALDNYSWRLGTGFLSTPFILYVLQKMDIEYAYRLLENEQIPGWLSMPKNGACTIWEDWEGPTSTQKGLASLNHYSKGAVLEWVIGEGCGIHVDSENHFVLSPNPGGHFTKMNAEYRSIYGKVSSGWKKENGKTVYSFEVPSNCTATVILPGETGKEYGPGLYEI